MNLTIDPDPRYPEWMKAWNARAAEIDQQIIDYFEENAEQTSEALVRIGDKLAAWWDAQHLGAEARAEFEKAKADAKLFRATVENRITHLIEDGKIRLILSSRK